MLARLLRVECLIQTGQLYLALMELDNLIRNPNPTVGQNRESPSMSNGRIQLLDGKCQSVSEYVLHLRDMAEGRMFIVSLR